jgi:hypothetical protein
LLQGEIDFHDFQIRPKTGHQPTRA